MSKTSENLKASPSSSLAPYDVENSKKCDVIDLEMKLQHTTSAIRAPLRRGEIKVVL